MRRLLRRLDPRRRDEQGAVLVMVAGAMAVITGASSLSIDIGRYVDNNRQMQLVADAASLDASQALNGSPYASVVDPVDAAALTSAKHNGFVPASAGGPAGNVLVVDIGMWDQATETFTPITDPADTVDIPNAVRVTAKQPTPFFFSTGTWTAQRPATATHVVSQSCPPGGCPIPPAPPPPPPGSPIGTLSIGSWLANFDSTQVGVLNSLFSSVGGVPGSVNLTAVGYQGMADVSVTLPELAAAASAGSVSQFLNATVTPAQFAGDVQNALQAEATALLQQGEASAAAAATTAQADVAQIAATLGGAPASASFDVCALVEVEGSCTPTGATAADASANVLSLLTAMAVLADGSSGFHTSISGQGFQIDASLIQPIQTGSGPLGYALSTNQVAVQLSTPLNVLGLTGAQLTINASGGTATGQLTALTCPTSTTAASMTIGVTTQSANLAAAATAVGAVTENGSATVTGNIASLDFVAPWPAPAQSTSTQAPATSLTISGADPLAAAADSVLNTVDPELAQVLQMLGISAAGATVQGDNLDCPGPTLVH